MKLTAMQDLKDDLIDTIESSLKALEEIKDKEIRSACQIVVKKTLNVIIERIDNELLEMEKQQIVEARIEIGMYKGLTYDEAKELSNKYYNETYKK